MTSTTETPVRRKSVRRWSLIVALFLSGVIGGVIVTGAPGKPEAREMLTGNLGGMVDPTFALLAIAILAITGILSVIWWRSIDEHEAAAYREGAMVAGHAYIGVGAVWYLAWAGGLAREPSGLFLFIAFSFVWSIVWLYRRYT